MLTFHLSGRITESGKLDVDLPQGLPAGEVQITLEMPAEDEIPWELRPWTSEELTELSKPNPLTGAEIVAWLKEEGGWEDDGSSAETWVEAVRRQEQEKRGW
jgi:hypothetical protein